MRHHRSLVNVQRQVRKTNHYIPTLFKQRFPRGLHDLGVGRRRLHESVLHDFDAPAGTG